MRYITENIDKVFLKDDSLEYFSVPKKGFCFEFEIYFTFKNSDKTRSFCLIKEENRSWHALGVRHHRTMDDYFCDICFDSTPYCDKMTNEEYNLKTFLLSHPVVIQFLKEKRLKTLVSHGINLTNYLDML